MQNIKNKMHTVLKDLYKQDSFYTFSRSCFYSEIRGNEGTERGWFPFWDGDLGRCIVGRDSG